MPQVIAIGEALVEIMRPEKQTPLDQPGLFQGPYASGAPAIFAVAASRMGLTVGFIGSIGRDGFGRLLDGRLREEGVNIDYLQKIPDYTTGIAFIAYAADGSREFIFHLRQSAASELSAGQLSADYFADVSWLHISGSALFLSEANRIAGARALSLTKSAGGKLSLDPNLRPELMAVNQACDVLVPYLEEADLLLPTAEEARAITGIDDDDGAAGALMNDRDRIVAFKRGREGASVFIQDNRFDIPGFAVSEIDPTGAGDCFNAGFIYGLEMGWPVTKAGIFAAATGALAVTQKGPMEGTPTNEQVGEYMRGVGETFEWE